MSEKSLGMWLKATNVIAAGVTRRTKLPRNEHP